MFAHPASALRTVLRSLPLVLVATILGGCASGPPELPAPQALVAPAPIHGTGGEFMAPYTRDAVLAGWVTRHVNTSGTGQAGAAVGGAVGAIAGQQLLSQVPGGSLIAGLFGQQIGSEAARAAAIEAAGGLEYVQESSDLSFAALEDYAVWMYATHGGGQHEDYDAALAAATGVYPQLGRVYHRAILAAPRRPLAAETSADPDASAVAANFSGRTDGADSE